MSSPARTAHATLALGVLLGLLHGCAHTSGTNESEAPDASERTPPSERNPRDPSTVTAEDIRREPGKPIEEILAGRTGG